MAWEYRVTQRFFSWELRTRIGDIYWSPAVYQVLCVKGITYIQSVHSWSLSKEVAIIVHIPKRLRLSRQATSQPSVCAGHAGWSVPALQQEGKRHPMGLVWAEGLSLVAAHACHPGSVAVIRITPLSSQNCTHVLCLKGKLSKDTSLNSKSTFLSNINILYWLVEGENQ